MNSGYGIGEHTEKSHHQHRGWRLGEAKWLSTMISGSYTMALVRACDDIIIIIKIIMIRAMLETGLCNVWSV